MYRRPMDPAVGQREALIWVSGFGEDAVDQSAALVAAHLAAGLDTVGGDHVDFAPALEVTIEPYGDGGANAAKAEVCTIFRQDGEERTPVLDVYRLRVQDVMTEETDSGGAIRRAFQAARVLLVYARKDAERRSRRGQRTKSRRQTLQAWLGHLYAAAVAAYLLVVLVGLAFAVIPGLEAWWADAVQVVAFLGAVLALLKAHALPTLMRVAAQNIGVVGYLEDGTKVEVLRGRFDALLEHIGDPARGPYRDVKIVGYSFGTIAMIDALFPADAPPVERYGRVSEIATIGCPFDLLRMYWPEHFEGRRPLPGAPRRWVNVYDPNDVVGSNFRDDDLTDEAEKTVGVPQGAAPAIKPENRRYPSTGRVGETSVWEALFLNGIKVHGAYWTPEAGAPRTAFTILAETLYADAPFMAAPVPAGA